MSYILFALIAIVFWSSSALAQLLPRGVGAYQLGYRKFDNNAQYFDESGKAHAAGEKFSTDFTGKDMSTGRAGSDLQRLYYEMKKFDSQGETKGVADEMNFGQVRGDIKTNIEAKFVGMAYGLSDRWTLFGAVPFVSASSDAEMHYGGSNNALAIKNRLGNLIYKEMQDALMTASRLSDETIRDNLENTKGYKNLDHWDYSGIGDVLVGTKTEVRGSQFGMSRLNLGLSGQLDLATGFQDDPDILIDLPISRGYHAITLGSDMKFSHRLTEGGLLFSITQGLPRDVVKRVPDGNESISGLDRKTTVHLQPGQDLGTGFYLGYGTSLLKGVYTVTAKKHLRDRYSGSLEGDYAEMEKQTEYSKANHRLGVSLSTVDAYSRKKFAIPFILTLNANDTFAGVNTGRERYVELSITSFFSTPAAAPSVSENRVKERNASRSVASH